MHLIATDEDRCLGDMWNKFKGKLHDGLYVRDEPKLSRYIKLEPQCDRPPIGWLELDNGFFFSVDRTMAEKFAKLFDVSAQIA